MTRDPSPLARQLTALKEDIQTLRQALVPLRQAKEDCLRQREQFRLRLKDKILSIKALKSHQDTLSQAVSDHRKERDVYNRQVRQLIQQARALQREKQQFLKQHKVKGNPLRLKEQIAHLEESIETEAYTYDRERKVMEKIKQMKKVYEESAGLATILDKLHEISAQIDAAQAQADTFHAQVKDSLQGSQAEVESFISTSKEITALRKDHDEAHQRFLQARQAFEEKHTHLQEKLAQLRALQTQLDEEEALHQKTHEERMAQILAERMRTVEEKFRQKKKLTTEDLIILQGKR